MAIHPDGYPTHDPQYDEITDAQMYCDTCDRDTEHTLSYDGEWDCQYIMLHAAAGSGLEDYVRESILEAFRRRLGAQVVSQREHDIAVAVAGMAERHVEDVVEVES